MNNYELNENELKRSSSSDSEKNDFEEIKSKKNNQNIYFKHNNQYSSFFQDNEFYKNNRRKNNVKLSVTRSGDIALYNIYNKNQIKYLSQKNTFLKKNTLFGKSVDKNTLFEKSVDKNENETNLNFLHFLEKSVGKNDIKDCLSQEKSFIKNKKSLKCYQKENENLKCDQKEDLSIDKNTLFEKKYYQKEDLSIDINEEEENENINKYNPNINYPTDIPIVLNYEQWKKIERLMVSGIFSTFVEKHENSIRKYQNYKN